MLIQGLNHQRFLIPRDFPCAAFHDHAMFFFDPIEVRILKNLATNRKFIRAHTLNFGGELKIHEAAEIGSADCGWLQGNGIISIISCRRSITILSRTIFVRKGRALAAKQDKE
jgi:hypothetical protein